MTKYAIFQKKEFDKRSGSLEFYEGLSISDKKILLSWIVLSKKAEIRKKNC